MSLGKQYMAVERGESDDKIQKRLIILAAAAFLSPLLLQLLPQPLFKILDDIVFFILLFDALVALKKKNIPIVFDRTCLLVTLLFSLYLFFEAANALIRHSSGYAVFMEFRHYKYLFLFCILFYYNSESVFTLIYRLARFIAYLSVPVAVIQRLVLPSSTGDIITGLYGNSASGIMTIMLLLLYFSEFARNMALGKRLIGWDIVYFIPIGLNETKIAFVLIPVLLVFTVLIVRKNILRNLVSVLLILAILLPSLSYVYTRIYSVNVWSYFTNKNEIHTYLLEANSKDMGRLLKISKAYEIIGATELTKAVGYGLGAGYVGSGPEKMGFIAGKYNDELLFGSTRTQLFDSLVETGILGVILQLMFISVIFIRLITAKSMRQDYYYVAVYSLILWVACLFYMVVIIQTNLFFLMITGIYMSCMNLPGSRPKGEEAGAAIVALNRESTKTTVIEGESATDEEGIDLHPKP